MSDMSDSNESWLIHQREQASERSSYESELTSRLRQQSTDDANTINALRETIERLTKEQRNDVDTINQLRLKKDAATARAERLETELRKVEWSTERGASCPVCHQTKTRGHASGCSLATVLKGEPK